MNYTDQEIAHQLGLGEDSQWEFKQIEFSGNRLPDTGRSALETVVERGRQSRSRKVTGKNGPSRTQRMRWSRP